MTTTHYLDDLPRCTRKLTLFGKLLRCESQIHHKDQGHIVTIHPANGRVIEIQISWWPEK